MRAVSRAGAREVGGAMLLIFGFRVFYRTVGEGTFHCQQCGGDRPYRHRVGRRWFHLFFIPVIPLGPAGEYVQCGQCGTKYVTGVLALPTTAQMQQALPAGIRAATAVMLQAGDPRSVAARRRVIDVVKVRGLPITTRPGSTPISHPPMRIATRPPLAG